MYIPALSLIESLTSIATHLLFVGAKRLATIHSLGPSGRDVVSLVPTAATMHRQAWAIVAACGALAAVASAAPAVPLDSWMGALLPTPVGRATLMDLALPGTHDSLTYDLSSTVADDANDMPPWASVLLHVFHDDVKLLGEFIRRHAQTQVLTAREQLEAGARFLDIRLVYTSPPNKSLGRRDWYSLHMVQSNQPARVYLDEVADFLRTHPDEVVVLFLSRHGNQHLTGGAQYPNATIAEKQACWADIKRIFGGMLFNSSRNRVNETSLATLVTTGQRAVVYAADWVEFTGSDPLALDAKRFFYNGGAGGSLADVPGSFRSWDAFFRGNDAQRATLKTEDTFFLVSLAGSGPVAALVDAAEVEIATAIHIGADAARKHCAAVFGIPNATEFCPLTLLNLERLRNFYSQVFLDRVATDPATYAPPGAIYLDVLGANGTIRTDTTAVDAHGFAYVDSLLLWNLQRLCGSDDPACAGLARIVATRRGLNPARRWESPSEGRHAVWPAAS